MNLSTIDLNLLHVLAVVLEERSATRAARRLHVTQSAVSNALARLRELLKDPLVTRQGRGLVPTPRALELQPRLAAALKELEQVVDTDTAFEATRCTREFTLACADNQQLSDLPRLCQALEREMPRARLRVVSIDMLLATDGLVTGEVDLAIAPTGAHPGMHSEPLYVESPVAVLHRDHPFRGDVLTPEAFARIPQVAFTVALGRPGIGSALTDRAFRASGLATVPSLHVSSFAAAAMVVASTERLVCMPRRVATVLAKHLPLRLIQLPIEGLTMQMSLVWHARTEADAASVCFRALLLRTLREPIGKAPAARRSRRKLEARSP
ncbi:MAG: LysR family transcriptional regulator [Cystobacter sp.]